MTSATHRSRWATVFVTLLASLGLLVATLPATAQAAPSTGSISGTISDSHGGVSGAWVYVYQSFTDSYATAVADSAGGYTFSGLPNGTYRIVAVELTGHLSAWYGGSDYDSATPVAVAGTDITGVDISLPRLAQVTGVITLPNGSAAGNATVTLWNATFDSGATTTTDAAGNFSIATGPGTFSLSAELADTCPQTFYTSSGSSTQKSQATAVAVAEDAHIFRNVALRPGTHFTGTVTTDGVATSDVTVLAQYLVDDKWVSAGQGYTDTQGHYSLMAGPGEYWLTFSHISSGHFRYQQVTVGATAANQTINMELLPGFETTPTPTISGDVSVGSTLTATAGTWLPEPDALSYQWQRNGANIPTATASTYVVASADVGAQLSVIVTATKADYLRTSNNSAATVTVPAPVVPTPQPTPPAPSVKTITGATPKIVGTAKVGKKLTVSRGTWKPSGLTFTYRWYRNGTAITAATKSSYKVTKADKGKYLTVKVTAKRSGYKTLSKTSKKTAKVR